MKNICKKLIIMFVMVLGIMGGYSVNTFASDDFEIGTSNLNGTVENSAKVGDKLDKPEIGWKRYDDKYKDLLYYGTLSNGDDTTKTKYYNSTYKYLKNEGSYLQFYFKGTSIRIISGLCQGRSNNILVQIDGIEKRVNANSTIYKFKTILYSETGLEDKEHIVKISIDSQTTNSNVETKAFDIDAIDINQEGYLITPTILLDKPKLFLQEGTSDNLVTTTTPEAVNVVWSSSDESIATVDQDGIVTGIKEGTCIITALIEGTDIKDTCEVTVTKEDVQEPEEPMGDGSLYIEMVDGNIKQAQDLDVADFIKWFKDRDLDDTESPIYKIKNAKGNTEYLVHDKIVAFEVR